MVENFNPTTIKETLPTSEYTAYSENKGEKLAFCLNKKKSNNENESYGFMWSTVGQHFST